ncbi:MAG: hypothetical protein ACXV7J_05440 [Methylomonas sp.]
MRRKAGKEWHLTGRSVYPDGFEAYGEAWVRTGQDEMTGRIPS